MKKVILFVLGIPVIVPVILIAWPFLLFWHLAMNKLDQYPEPEIDSTSDCLSACAFLAVQICWLAGLIVFLSVSGILFSGLIS